MGHKFKIETIRVQQVAVFEALASERPDPLAFCS